MYFLELFSNKMFQVIINFISKIIIRFFQQALVVDGMSVEMIFANITAIEKIQRRIDYGDKLRLMGHSRLCLVFRNVFLKYPDYFKKCCNL